MRGDGDLHDPVRGRLDERDREDHDHAAGAQRRRRRGAASVATRGTVRYVVRTAGAVASASAPTAVMTAATIVAT